MNEWFDGGRKQEGKHLLLFSISGLLSTRDVCVGQSRSLFLPDYPLKNLYESTKKHVRKEPCAEDAYRGELPPFSFCFTVASRAYQPLRDINTRQGIMGACHHFSPFFWVELSH